MEEIKDLPFTISYVIRKRQQTDAINEYPEEKRPPEKMIWDGDSDELDRWMKNIYSSKTPNVIELDIKEDEIG